MGLKEVLLGVRSAACEAAYSVFLKDVVNDIYLGGLVEEIGLDWLPVSGVVLPCQEMIPWLFAQLSPLAGTIGWPVVVSQVSEVIAWHGATGLWQQGLSLGDCIARARIWFSQPPPDPDLVAVVPPGHKLYLMTDPRHLKAESESMISCVGDPLYQARLRHPGFRLYSLCRPDDSSALTIELRWLGIDWMLRRFEVSGLLTSGNCWVPTQIQGKFNVTPIEGRKLNKVACASLSTLQPDLRFWSYQPLSVLPDEMLDWILRRTVSEWSLTDHKLRDPSESVKHALWHRINSHLTRSRRWQDIALPGLGEFCRALLMYHRGSRSVVSVTFRWCVHMPSPAIERASVFCRLAVYASDSDEDCTEEDLLFDICSPGHQSRRDLAVALSSLNDAVFSVDRIYRQEDHAKAGSPEALAEAAAAALAAFVRLYPNADRDGDGESGIAILRANMREKLCSTSTQAADCTADSRTGSSALSADKMSSISDLRSATGST